MSLCFISNLPSLILTRLHRVTVIPPSPAALASGSDQDYQLDIISELDLANATYGITQVAGLHNNSKAFLFRGNARTHARTHWRFLPQKFWTVFVSRVHTRVSTRLFVLLVSVIKGAHATPLWRDRGRTPGGASSHNYSTFHSSFIRRCSDSSGLTGAPRDVHQQEFHTTNVASATAASQISGYLCETKIKFALAVKRCCWRTLPHVTVAQLSRAWLHFSAAGLVLSSLSPVSFAAATLWPFARICVFFTR